MPHENVKNLYTAVTKTWIERSRARASRLFWENALPGQEQRHPLLYLPAENKEKKAGLVVVRSLCRPEPGKPVFTDQQFADVVG